MHASCTYKYTIVVRISWKSKLFIQKSCLQAYKLLRKVYFNPLLFILESSQVIHRPVVASAWRFSADNTCICCCKCCYNPLRSTSSFDWRFQIFLATRKWKLYINFNPLSFVYFCPFVPPEDNAVLWTSFTDAF